VLLSRRTLSGVALTVALAISAQPASSRDDAWGGSAWQRYQGSDYDAGYRGPTELPNERDPGRSAYPFETASPFREPSWAHDDPSIPATRGAGYGDYRYDEPYGRPQQGYTGAQRGDPPGAFGGRSQGRTSPSERPSPGAPGYQPDYPGSAFPPRELAEGLELGLGQMVPVPGPGYRDPPLETHPGYRFRGDPPAGLGHWQSAPDPMGYRFRPLTEQERGRQDLGPHPRPRYPQGTAPEGTGGVPFRGEPLLQPEAAFGFEPNPWRAR